MREALMTLNNLTPIHGYDIRRLFVYTKYVSARMRVPVWKCALRQETRTCV